MHYRGRFHAKAQNIARRRTTAESTIYAAAAFEADGDWKRF